MKLFFSPRTKLVKLAEESARCRLCGTPKDQKKDESSPPSSVAVVPYSLTDEPSTTKFNVEKVPGCATCNGTGKVKTAPPNYRECPTCKPGTRTDNGVGLGPGLYRSNVCPTCYNHGYKLIRKYNDVGYDQVECETCHGDVEKIPPKICPTCEDSDKPGFIQEGESSHDILCPTCKGSRTHAKTTPYTPILQVKCPHENGVDTFTKPNGSDTTNELGPHDRNYFEGRRLLPLKLLWKIRGIESKFTHHKKIGVDLNDFNGETREVGALTPALPQVQSSKEPSYLEFFSRTELLDPNRTREASNSFKRAKSYFNSKEAKNDEPNSSDGGLGDDFFGRIEDSPKEQQTADSDLEDFLPKGLSIDPAPTSRRTRSLTPEESKRLRGGPVTTRQVDETDMLRPFENNPSRAIERTKSALGAQKQLGEKRSRMSNMFKKMTSYEEEPDEEIRAKNLSLGLVPTYRGWRDNFQHVSENLDLFNKIRGTLRNTLSNVKGERVKPEISTAMTSQLFRKGVKAKNQKGEVVADLGQHRLGITEPMPYIKNDENWRETHNGLGCNHDPGDGHEPGVGCIIDYFNHPSNPKGGVTTGTNSRLVVGKYTTEEGKTVLRTVGARLKRAAETGEEKRTIRGATPRWTPENFGRVVELPAENATCVPNKIQRDHYLVNHTIEPPSERAEVTDLPIEETGMPNLSPEPVLNKEKVKFPEEIREGGPTESVYVGNPLYQLTNPFSTQEVTNGMWANNPAVQHIARQIKDGRAPTKFKSYTPEPKFNSQQMRDRPGLTGRPANEETDGIGSDDFDLNLFFEGDAEDKPPKTSKKEENKINPVEQDADETYDYNKKIKLQPMDRTQVKMVEPTNPTAPDITPDVPKVNNK